MKAITEGVVRLPSLFCITVGWLPSMTDTQEFVVPRSIPMILPIKFVNFFDFHLINDNGNAKRQGGGHACQKETPGKRL
jgi:hypothetical protein